MVSIMAGSDDNGCPKGMRVASARTVRESATQLNVKPAVGFTLPSAGVTPAPSVNRKVARGALLCSRATKDDPVPLPAREGVRG
jgi:hypothetical protein